MLVTHVCISSSDRVGYSLFCHSGGGASGGHLSIWLEVIAGKSEAMATPTLTYENDEQKRQQS